MMPTQSPAHRPIGATLNFITRHARAALLYALAASLALSHAYAAPVAGGMIPVGPTGIGVSAAAATAEQKGSAEAVKDFPTMFKVGNYDEIIRRCSALMGQPDIVTSAGLILGQAQPEPQKAPAVRPEPDGSLLYWRGLSAYRIGWFGMAKSDLTQAGEKGVGLGTSQKILDDIEKLRALLPPEVYEIRSGDYVIFRVYYTQMDDFTKRVINILDESYQTNRKLLNSDLIETPVYIFNGYLSFYQLCSIRSGSPPPSYALATGGRDGFYISLQARSGEPAFDVQGNNLENMVTHELNHSMLSRSIGTVELPNWFLEGFADFAGSEVVLERKAANNRRMAQMLRAKNIIAPALLEGRESFGAYAELGHAMQEGGAGESAPSSYAQSFNMTRYLMNNIRAGQLPKFLLRVRAEQSFSQAFEEEFNATMPQFYEAWYQNLGPSLQR